MRYRLRTLLIVVTCAAVLLGLFKAGLLIPVLLVVFGVTAYVGMALRLPWAADLVLVALVVLTLAALLMPAVMH